jgi:hypothetical protein
MPKKIQTITIPNPEPTLTTIIPTIPPTLTTPITPTTPAKSEIKIRLIVDPKSKKARISDDSISTPTFSRKAVALDDSFTSPTSLPLNSSKIRLRIGETILFNRNLK